MKYKSVLFILILIIAFLLPSLTSCASRLTGTETAVSFLEEICDKNFDSAYDFVQTDLSKDEFIDTYNSFFNILDIKSVKYENTETFDTEIYSLYNYTLTYETKSYGNITDKYSITVKLDEKKRHYVDWAPALLLPEMENGDTVCNSRISANRGDIITDHTVLAENVPVISVSIQTEKYDNDAILKNVQIVCDALSLDFDDVKKKVSYTVILDTKASDSDTAVFSEQLDKNIQIICDKLNLSEEKIRTLIKEAGDAKSVEVQTYLPNDIDHTILTELSSYEGISVKSSIYNGVALIAEYSPVRIDDASMEKLSQYDGISVKESSYSTTRYYPHGSTLAHILGYTGSMSADTADEEAARLNEGRTETDGLYTRYSITGRNGIEQAYETQLRGLDGYRIYIKSADGRNKRTIFEKPASDGLDVELTVDFELQEKAEALLENTLYGTNTAGAVIVMNPQTGEVQAIASYPTYDLNHFASGITQDEHAAYLAMNKPFLNRALQGRYAPGSVYKPITAAAALESHVIDTDYEFTGEIINDTWRIPEKYGSTSATDRIKRTHVNRRYSPLNMRNALLHSDNIYFANAALKIGDAAMEEYWNKLRLNEKIDFELPIASSQFKNPNDTNRNVIQIAETGFGQGTMLVTPLQLACVYCAFANGGDIPTPHIVKGLYRETANSYDAVEITQTAIWKRNAIDSDVCSTLTAMLKDVVSPKYNGTGQQLKVQSCVVAGKTGTAEVEKGKKDNSWFVGYRTGVEDEDQRLVLVVLEVPAQEKYTALKFDIARNLLELD